MNSSPPQPSIARLGIMPRVPPGTIVSLYTEAGNAFDFYGRQLACVILPDGSCLNDLLIEQGYAKAESEYSCKELARYQAENWNAKLEKRGLYAIT